MRYDVVKKVVALIYTGSVEVPLNDMEDFLRAATFLKLHGFAGAFNENEVPAEQIKMVKPFEIRLHRIDTSILNSIQKNGAIVVPEEMISSTDQADDKAEEKFLPSDSSLSDDDDSNKMN